MATVNDITDYVITKAKLEEEKVSLSNLKLQKILYYIQAWSYGINNKPLFEGEFQAWVHGPVNKEIYDRFKATKTLYSEIELGDIVSNNFEQNMNDEDKAFVDFILENYLRFSGSELEIMSHQEDPWINARKDLNEYERSENIISSEDMKEYYGNRWEEINR